MILWLMAVSLLPVDALLAEALSGAVSPVPRPLLPWMEEEVVIPTGKHRDLPFSADTQPFTRLLLEQLNESRWNEIVITGPSQSGKTTIGFTAPLLYVAAELREPVVVALPDLAMTGDKWQLDIAPILQASPRLRALIPRTGPGSRGGTVKDVIRLANGAVIKFMTKGGSDQSKAGFPGCRFLRVTEAAGFSHAADTSVEADPFRQIKARLASYDLDETQTIIEGTVTLEDELPWRLYAESTQSRIVCPCPHCGSWIAPEREDFRGWEEAEHELEAAARGAFFCPECGEAITDEERLVANRAARLVHAGQTIDEEGQVSGPVPPTTRLWFRWSAFHNCLVSSRTLAVKEWEAARLPEDTRERESAEKALCQFVWCVPWRPVLREIEPLTPEHVSRAAVDLPKGVCPADTNWLTVFVDLGMYWCHWVAVAWRENRAGHVCDYETFPVLARGGTKEERRRNVRVVLSEALTSFRDRCRLGWQRDGGGPVLPDRVWIDAGAWTDTVFATCRALGDPFLPAIGRGTGQRDSRPYVHPKRVGSEVRLLGERYCLRRHAKHRQLYVETDADYWKGQVHEALAVAAGEPGGLTLFLDQQRDHATFRRHLTAERVEEEVHPTHGVVQVWRNPGGRPNHYFDATYGAFVAGHHAGFRLLESERAQPAEVTSWFGRRR